MIKRINFIGAIITSLVFLYGSTASSWIYFSYEINKLEIIEKFCINKDVEEYTCEGKCHLMTQLDESEEENPFDSQSKINQKESLLLFKTDFSALTIDYKPQLESLFNSTENQYSFLYSSNSFRPPTS
jgi:hypothetical protein